MSPSPVPPTRRPGAPSGRPRAGFTLIELLVCVVIVGLLAAFAVPRFANTTAKANLASVRSDLRQVVSAEEGYFHEHQSYTTSLALLGVRLSRGVQVTVVTAGPAGWSALAVHPAAVPVTCAVFYGQAAPVAPATAEGVITCE